MDIQTLLLHFLYIEKFAVHCCTCSFTCTFATVSEELRTRVCTPKPIWALATNDNTIKEEIPQHYISTHLTPPPHIQHCLWYLCCTTLLPHCIFSKMVRTQVKKEDNQKKEISEQIEDTITTKHTTPLKPPTPHILLKRTLCPTTTFTYRVHSPAVFSYCFLLVLYKRAISGTNGSSGLGSVNNEQIDNNTLEMVNAGLHWSFKMSKQIPPFALMLGWYILVLNFTLGGLKG